MNAKPSAIAFVCACLGLFGAAPEVQADCTNPPLYTWIGENTNWHDVDNWGPNQNHIPTTGDAVYIPSVDSNLYPVITSNSVEICALELDKSDPEGSAPTVTVDEHASTYNTLTVTGRNGLVVGANCAIRLMKHGGLILEAAGTVELDGRIVFADSAVQQRPFLTLPAGATMLTGSGMILGRDDDSGDEEEFGLILGDGQHESWLVVGPNNGLHGSLWIDVGLVNNGVVDPNAQDAPTYGRRVYLYCLPKIGSGRWDVTGGASGENQENKLIVLAPVAGTGSLKVGAYGLLDIQNHMTGFKKLELEGNAQYSVLQNVLFDVNRFVRTCAHTE
ncbi:MAG: hypothetical protein FLDDKLPJ_01358 [Phycisphaerae bacterium]|nr:hypothetical protein [Phycisphaerae bacterium]